MKTLSKSEALSKIEQLELVMPANATTHPNNPELAIKALGGLSAIHYKADVESLSLTETQKHLDVISPVEDPVRPLWSIQEFWHGEVYYAELSSMGIEVERAQPREVTPKQRALGLLGRKFSFIGDSIALAIPKIGHLHENENSAVIQMDIQRLKRVGEHELARTHGRIHYMELAHDRYYRADIADKTEALLRRGRSSVVNMSNLIVAHVFRPVGATTNEMQRRFGGVMATLLEDEDAENKFIEKVERLTSDLIANNPNNMTRVESYRVRKILNTFQECKQLFLTTV